jgi:hypothetical protein
MVMVSFLLTAIHPYTCNTRIRYHQWKALPLDVRESRSIEYENGCGPGRRLAFR